MKEYKILFAVGIFTAMLGLASCSSGDEPTQVEPLPDFPMTPAEHEIAKAQNNFQIEMFADIVKINMVNKTNLNYSPLNASIALSVLANAADTENAKKICSMIGCDDIVALNAYNKRLNAYLPKQANGDTLELANGVWYEHGLTLLPFFVENVTGVYGTTPASVYFEKSETIELINAWALEKTHGLIDGIVDRINLPISTQMFIASALYYKGSWEDKFDKRNTRDRVFHGVDGDKNVPTMCKQDYFSYNQNDDGAEILRIPFTDYRISLYVVLPPEETDVVEYASSFTSERFDAMVGNMDFYKVNVYIPKFMYKDEISLNGYLVNKGINISGFTMSGAGLSATNSLGTLQKTYFSIDEDGVELAAVTGLITGAPKPQDIIDFKVDRPFIFFVREEKTGSILMAGVMRDIPLDK